MQSSAIDEAFMSRALALAEATAALASPNPQVGCVLVREGQVLAEAAHLYDLRDHAEVAALKLCARQGIDPRGATAYVTLEPCAHHGRTGPCADALIAAGVSRCVVATLDPNPLVAGQGVTRLRAAGIAIGLGVLEREARALNDAFAFSITRHRPFVTLKAALSVDGMLAPTPAQRTPGEPFWLTGTEAREDVQRLRHNSDAVLTGIGTVLADDPLLTDRTGLPRRRPLMRVVLDSDLRFTLGSKLDRSAQDDLMLFVNHRLSQERADPFIQRQISIDRVPERNRALDLHAVLGRLHRLSIRSVLLEAGSRLNASFLGEGLVDRVILYYSTTELGSGAIPFTRDGPTPFAVEQQMVAVSRRQIGPDVRVSGLLHDPWVNSSRSRLSYTHVHRFGASHRRHRRRGPIPRGWTHALYRLRTGARAAATPG